MSEFNNQNPEINTKQITMSEHAYQRAAERFNLKDRVSALGSFRGILRKATYIGEVTDEDGKPAILYGHGRSAIYLSLDLKLIKTVMREEYVSYDPIKKKVAELHAKEIRKLDRTIKARIRKLNTTKDDANIEIAELTRRIHRTRSESIRGACQLRIKAINVYLTELQTEIESLQTSKRQIARSMISVV